MIVRVHRTNPLPHLHLPSRRRVDREGDGRWLEGLPGALRARLVSPPLRTLAIVAIDLRPHGAAYWAPGTRRVAVVALAPGFGGYDTARRLNPVQRGELARALVALCGVDAIELRPVGAWRVALGDGLAVGGHLLATLGGLGALSAREWPVWLAAAALGVAAALAGEALAPAAGRESQPPAGQAGDGPPRRGTRGLA